MNHRVGFRWRHESSAKVGAIGFVAGLSNGLLSVGGGFIIVPGLVILRGASAQQAVPTSLAAVFVLSLLALVSHVVVSGYSLSVEGSILLLVGGMIGAQIGSRVLSRISERVLLIAIPTVTLVSAMRLALMTLGDAPALIDDAEPPLISYAPIGCLSGILAGALGLGGGGIALLLFAIAFQTPVLGWLPIALALNAANSLGGVLAHAGKKNVLWGDVARMVPTSIVGVAVGVAGATSLAPDSLRLVFALSFLVTGLPMLWRGVRAKPKR